MTHLGLTDQYVTRYFPSLAPPAVGPANHVRTSDPSDNYNCIAHAYGIDHHPMWPGEPAPFWWPGHIPDDRAVPSFVALFEDVGYELCPAADQEPGYEKVAIFATPSGPTHAARQLPSGKWTSKLGNAADIEHEALGDIDGDLYGTAIRFLRRPLATP